MRRVELRWIDQQWFNRHQFDSESLVIGKLVHARENHILSEAGQMGRFYGLPGGRDPSQTNRYLGKVTGGEFRGYDSQIGLQGMAFSTFEKLLIHYTPFTPKQRIKLYHALNAALFALVTTAILWLFYLELGLLPALVIAGTLLLSQWFIIFGRNMYWVFWIMYLPFLTVFALHRREATGGGLWLKSGLVAVAFLIFCKSAAGYEYISSVGFAMLTPVIYYAIQQQWTWRRFILRMFLFGSAAIIGFVAANAVHLLQTAHVEQKTLERTFHERLNHATSRLHSREKEGKSRWDEATRASTTEVLKLYWRGKAVEWQSPFNPKKKDSIRFGTLVVFFAVVSAFTIGLSRRASAQKARLYALVGALWFSALAPLSWFVLAKVHSYVHPHMNYVLWHLPFTLFGFALAGYTMKLLLYRGQDLKSTRVDAGDAIL